jgi:succinoglycan biosynthesis protein ExoA
VGDTGGQVRVHVSVLTPVLDEAAGIRAAARTMLAQRFDGEIEFIFIDGRSRDGTAEEIRKLAANDRRVRLLDNPERRTPDALNLGLRAARGEFVARMDAHTLYPADYLALGVERLRRGDVEHVSGPQLPRGAGPWSRRAALALGCRLGTGGASFRHAGDRETEVRSGFTGVWRRETLERHGGWDDGWPINQDAELAARIAAEGGRLVCLPAMAADYIPRESLRALARQYFRYGLYRAKTSRRHPESMARSHLLPPAVVLAAAGAAAARPPLRSLARAALASYAAVLCVNALAAAARGDGEARDAAWLPVVLVAMHLPWGAGFLLGAARFGPPITALRRVMTPSD